MPIGTVVTLIDKTADYQFGFIAPQHSRVRSDNVFFDTKSLHGEIVRVGERVSYELYTKSKYTERGPAAHRVLPLYDAEQNLITYTGGD